MIKLSRGESPPYLSESKIAMLVKKFKEDGAPVWNHDGIKVPLLASAWCKCAYCECRLDEECKYMEVEHFRDKDSNPDLVVDWYNLLPSCKRCNVAKGTHDVDAGPIINPYDDDPRDHLSLRAYRLRPVTSVGLNSIEVLDLNNSMRVVASRFKVGEFIISGLERAEEQRVAWVLNKTTRSRNALIRSVEAILLECQPGSEYAATAATVLHGEEVYMELVVFFERQDFWSPHLAGLHAASKSLVLKSS